MPNSDIDLSHLDCIARLLLGLGYPPDSAWDMPRLTRPMRIGWIAADQKNPPLTVLIYRYNNLDVWDSEAPMYLIPCFLREEVTADFLHLSKQIGKKFCPLRLHYMSLHTR